MFYVGINLNIFMFKRDYFYLLEVEMFLRVNFKFFFYYWLNLMYLFHLFGQFSNLMIHFAFFPKLEHGDSMMLAFN